MFVNMQGARELNSDELLLVSGGGGSDPLPNVVYTTHIGDDENGPLYQNTWYTSQGELISQETSHENEYQRELDRDKQFETSPVDLDIPFPNIEFEIDNNTGYIDTYYGSSTIYVDVPRSFDGRIIDWQGVSVNGEIAYA